jgi:hypothetical protein
VPVIDHLDEEETYSERHESEREEGPKEQEPSGAAHALAGGVMKKLTARVRW